MRVGFGRGIITPKGKIAIAGNIPQRVTDIVHDDVQLTNDTLEYLPTKKAIEHDGYSTDYCSTITTPEGGEYYIQEIKKMLNNIKA